MNRFGTNLTDDKQAAQKQFEAALIAAVETPVFRLCVTCFGFPEMAIAVRTSASAKETSEKVLRKRVKVLVTSLSAE